MNRSGDTSAVKAVALGAGRASAKNPDRNEDRVHRAVIVNNAKTHVRMRIQLRAPAE